MDSNIKLSQRVDTPQSILNGTNRFCTDKILQGLDMEIMVNVGNDNENNGSVVMDKEVIEEHVKCNHQISKLGKQLSQILDKHEKDFLQAYKEQMIEVQEELKTLKIKIDDDSLRDKDNAKMTCLEHERDWFRAEAQRLDNICKDQTEQIKEMTFKNKILIDDKNYYEGFVIETKKENKMIKNDIMKLYGQSEYDQMNNRLTGSQQFQFQQSDDQIISEAQDQDDLETKQSHLKIDRELQNQQQSTIEEDEQKQLKQLKALEQEIKNYQEKSFFLQQQKKGNIKQRIELEYVLQNCTEEVKKDIYKSKMSFNRSQRFNQSQEMEIDFNRFSMSDKKNVVEKLMQNGKIIDQVYTIIFTDSKQLKATQSMKKKRKGYSRGSNSRSKQYLPNIKSKKSKKYRNTKSKKSMFKKIPKH